MIFRLHVFAIFISQQQQQQQDNNKNNTYQQKQEEEEKKKRNEKNQRHMKYTYLYYSYKKVTYFSPLPVEVGEENYGPSYRWK